MNRADDPTEADALALLASEFGARVIGAGLVGQPREEDDAPAPEYGRAARPEDVPGLREVVVSVVRKPSRRLNPLVILCPAGTHVMGRVYRAPCGLVLVGVDGAWGMVEAHLDRLAHARGAERTMVAVMLEATYEPHRSDDPRSWSVCEFSLQCRCQRVPLSVAQVNEMFVPGHPHRIRIPSPR